MAITVVATGESGSSANSSTYTSDNITAAGRDIIVCFVAGAADTTTQIVSSVSMPSIGSSNWTSITGFRNNSPSSQWYESFWAEVPAGGVTGEQITSTWNETINRGQIHVLVITGADTRNPIVQSGYSQVVDGGHITVNLNPFKTDSVTVGGLFHHNASQDIYFPTTPAWTNGTRVEPGEALEGRAGYYIGEDTDVTTEGSSFDSDRGLIVMEIAAARLNQFISKPSPELVTNGGFDTDTVWTKALSCTISGGSASVIDGGDITQDPIGPYINGHLYRTVFEVTSFSSSGNGVYIRFIGAGGDGLTGIVRTATGSYTQDITMTATNDQLKFRSLSNNECSIDNVSVKEVKTIAKPSTELITNGGFDADTDWNKGTGWTISDGVATKSPGTQSNVSQTLGTVLGKRYRVTFTVSNYVAGIVRPFLGTVVGTNRTANGTYVEDITYTEGSDGISIQGTSTFEGDIDNVSVKEVKAIIK